MSDPTTTPTPPEPLDLAAIRARAEGGTEGTWTADRQTGQIWANPGEPVLVAQVGWAEDADFIAHAREDVPALLAALDAAHAETEREHREAVTWRDLARAEKDQRDEARAALAALRKWVGLLADDLERPDASTLAVKRVVAERLRAALAAAPSETEEG